MDEIASAMAAPGDGPRGTRNPGAMARRTRSGLQVAAGELHRVARGAARGPLEGTVEGVVVHRDLRVQLAHRRGQGPAQLRRQLFEEAIQFHAGHGGSLGRGFRLPIIPHELRGPVGLMDFGAGKEFAHDGLEVEDRRAIQRIQLGDDKGAAFALQDANDGGADAIRAVLPALGEDAHLGPLRVVPWMPRARDDLRRVHLIKDEDHFRMGECLQPLQRRFIEALRQLDAGHAPAPEVVLRDRAGGPDERDGGEVHEPRLGAVVVSLNPQAASGNREGCDQNRAYAGAMGRAQIQHHDDADCEHAVTGVAESFGAGFVHGR